MRVCIIITDGFEEAETLCPLDILKRGNVTVDLYSLKGTQATGRSEITITNLLPLDKLDLSEYDCLLLPGGPQWRAIESSKEVQGIIAEAFAKDMYVAAICAAPTILGRAGYLKDRDYTCFTSLNDDFGGRFHETYVVKDGKLITACSAAAAIDFGLEVLETLTDKDNAEKVKQDIYYYNRDKS